MSQNAAIYGYVEYQDEEKAQQITEELLQPWVDSTTSGTIERRGNHIELKGYFRNLM